jgi:hypothetical protein
MLPRCTCALQRLAHVDIADDVVGLAMNDRQCGFGLFHCAGLKLSEFETTFAIEFVFDDVLGRLGHGRSCSSFCLIVGLAGFSAVSSWIGG